MNIQLLSLHNFAQVRAAEYKFGKFNIISGKNAQGKSTVLNGVKYLFNGGNEAELITNGEEQGEVVVILDNGSTARRRIAPASKSQKFSMRDGDGNPVQSPATALREQFDTFALDPVAFIKAKNEDQTRLLLESLDVPLDDKALSETLGRKVERAGEHPIVFLQSLRKQFYNERTDVNRSIKEKSTHITELEKTLPADVASTGSMTDRIKQLESEKTAIEDKRMQRKEEYSESANAALLALQTEREAKMREIDEWYNEGRDRIKQLRDEKVEDMMQKSGAKYTRICDELTTLRLNAENETVWASTKLTIKHNKELLDSETKKQEELNGLLQAIDDIKESIFKNLPIKGVEIVDGVIHVNGTSINQLSQSEGLRFAVKVATMRMGDVKAVLVDNGECFDTESFATLCTICEEADAQLFVAIVTDSEDVVVEAAQDAGDAVKKRSAALKSVAA